MILVILVMAALSAAAFQEEKLLPGQRMVRAVQYPFDQKVKLTLFPTGRLEGIEGSAEVRRQKAGTEVEVDLENAPSPSQLQADYKAYVIWALTRDGKFVNLGAIERAGKMKTTTNISSFGIVVSAESDPKAAAMSDAVLESGYPLGKRRIYPMHRVLYVPRPGAR